MKSTLLKLGINCACLLLAQNSFANLIVFPTRVELKGRQKSAQFSVRHNFTETKEVNVSAAFYKMNANGKMTQIQKDPEKQEWSLIPALRFSPRQVTLKPGETQTIRLRVYSKGELNEGVYRAHLIFTPNDVPKEEIANNSKSKKKELNMNLKFIVSLAVPVYYTAGDPKSSVTIGNQRIEGEKEDKFFTFDLLRKGEGLVRGDAHLMINSEGSKSKEIGLIRELATYVPKRSVKMPLQKENLALLKKGAKLTLEFRKSKKPEADDDEQDDKVLSSAELVL
ncbi:hypothetical protein GW915_07000 [bacterium]|nr:hypothetical protein [bacterium]